MKCKRGTTELGQLLLRHWLVFKQFAKVNRRELIRTYVFVPIGVIAIMCLLYGVDRLIQNYIKVTFPASVAVMLINFAFMCCLSAFKKPYCDFYVSIIDIPLSWALRWMNLFFTPAFVTLPLSPWISYKEALLIVAVFIIGYLIAFVLLAYITILGQKLIGLRGLKSIFVRQEELQNGVVMGSRFTPLSISRNRNDSISSSSSVNDEDNGPQIPANGTNPLYFHYDDDYADSQTGPDVNSNLSDPLVSLASNSGLYLSKLNSHATSVVPASLPADSYYADVNIDVTDSDADRAVNHSDVGSTSNNIISGSSHAVRTSSSDPLNHIKNRSKLLSKLQPAVRKKPDSREAVSSISSKSPEGRTVCQRAITRQYSKQFDFYFSISMWENHLHHFIFSVGLFATIFTYYFQWYIAPYQLFTAIVMFMIVIDSPFIVNRPKLKRFAHPVICSVALTWIVMLISVMIKHRNVSFFITELKEYKTGRTYLYLFDNEKFGYHTWSGAGDIFTSCMDVSIVALSLPMFTYRKDLQKHFFAMVPPIILFTAASLLLYPLVCYHIGISSTRAIGFSGRSVTLALGTPMIANLGGDQTVMAVTTVMSGIVGALTGGPMMDFIKVPEEDYVTRGLTLGCNCGAIATAYLLGVDRRAAAISSLSFVFYGALMVILSAIGPVKTFVHTLVGL